MENLINKPAVLPTVSSKRISYYEKRIASAILMESSLYHLQDGKKLMSAVNRIVIGKNFNFLEMLDGTKKAYTADWKLLTRRVEFYATVGKFLITSEGAGERVSTYNLVKGDKLKVFGESGALIHDGIRAFMQINQLYHLVRRADGGWVYCCADGQALRLQPFCKTNLSVGSKTMMFDETGKLRLGMRNAYYNDNLMF